ncbi:MFS transporter [Amycolatopsis sp. PS_44_ISF1]|uniref:MFS transporter n=1 Tax=Amycolatopsis sp. PS_44_ISF1 TaxID=2974917 RepID=UPI0028DDFEEF|nr:MFS transporter [Amycolatopsis sp. PS_44_ISF1]MDT8912997.1 MFS transporter [Amycolatopsis sp. PS_44_ISF1]
MNSAATAPEARSGEARFDRRLYAPLVLGSVLNPITSTMIAVTLAPIGRSFGVGPADTAWLVSGLYLATAIGQPVVGRLVDAFGARRVFLIATSVAGLAGLAGAFAPDLGPLIAVRIGLGLATCAGYPASMHLIRREADRQGLGTPATALSVLSLAGQATVVLGPTIGGLLVGLGGWRAVFAVSVPLALAALVLGALILPREHPVRSGPLNLDVAGMAAFAATIVTLLLFFVRPAPGRVFLLVIAAVAAVAFVLREVRADDPFIDLRLLRATPALSLVYARALISGVFQYSFLYGFTQWLQDGAHLSASHAGLLLLPMSILALVLTLVTGRSPRIRGKLVLGGLTQLLAAGLMLLCTPAGPVWLFLAVSLAAGVPNGLISLANQNALYRVAPAGRTASSAGLLRTFLYVGAIVSSTTNGALLGAGATGPHDTGLHDIAVLLLVLAGVFAALTLLDRTLRTGTKETRPA